MPPVIATPSLVARSLYDAWEASKRKLYAQQEWEGIHMTALWYRAVWEGGARYCAQRDPVLAAVKAWAGDSARVLGAAQHEAPLRL
jgi:hypothetical protein